jgi:DNA invertase Pin-like site-specific DNA recombinase
MPRPLSRQRGNGVLLDSKRSEVEAESLSKKPAKHPRSDPDQILVYARTRVDMTRSLLYTTDMGKKPRCIKAVAYVRVSTGKQDLSMDAQEERIRLYCQFNGLELVELIRERSVTGKLKLNKRPEGKRIAELTAAGVCHIVALKLDRLFRNAVDALSHVEEWEQAGINLHLVDMGGQSVNTGSSIGKMLITMLAGFAEFERNMIAERTTAALRYKKAHREVYNHTPYGWDAEDGALVENPAERAVVVRMQALRADGTSYNEIANALNADAVPTKKGGIWRSQTVKNILEAAA